MFKELLDSYIEVCNEIITSSANSVILFEAGERAAGGMKIKSFEELKKFFEIANIRVSCERTDNKVVFSVSGLQHDKEQCYFNLLKGFFGEIARNLFDPGFFAKESFIDKEKCIFIVELVK